MPGTALSEGPHLSQASQSHVLPNQQLLKQIKAALVFRWVNSAASPFLPSAIKAGWTQSLTKFFFFSAPPGCHKNPAAEAAFWKVSAGGDHWETGTLRREVSLEKFGGVWRSLEEFGGAVSLPGSSEGTSPVDAH